jgi:hypothetical protein
MAFTAITDLVIEKTACTLGIRYQLSCDSELKK